MKRKPLTHAARLLCALALSMSLALPPLPPTRLNPPSRPLLSHRRHPGEDGTEIRKMYDLGPEDDPGGIPGPTLNRTATTTPLTDLLETGTPRQREPPAYRNRVREQQEQGYGRGAGPAAADKGSLSQKMACPGC